MVQSDHEKAASPDVVNPSGHEFRDADKFCEAALLYEVHES